MASQQFLDLLKKCGPSAAKLCPIYIKLPAENIVTLKCLLESYEQLGITRTINSDAGEVVILAVSDTVNTLMELLEEVREELNLRLIPPPGSLSEDWLLGAETDSD